MAPLQQLSEVLDFLAMDRGNSTLVQIQSRLKNEKLVEFDADVLSQVLNKIVKDGFADFEDERFQKTDAEIAMSRSIDPKIKRKYFITYEGHIFHSAGGYIQQVIDSSNENDKRATIERIRRRNEKWTMRGAVGAAIGAVALVVWEILKAIYDHDY